MVASGEIEMVVSDHSPSTLVLKQGDDYAKVWGGISGCQSTRQLMLAQPNLDPTVIAAATATNIARRFRLLNKGDIAPGFDADLWIVDLSHEDVVRRDDLLYRNRFSAHEGQRIRGKTIKTLNSGALTLSLKAGTYYLRLYSPNFIDTVYKVTTKTTFSTTTIAA